LNWLFEIRGVGDDGVSEHVPAGEASRSIKIAEKFLESTKEILS
jgi:hypothetical protein